jgi:hypothetical protein
LEYPIYALSLEDQEYIKKWSPLLGHAITAELLGDLWQYDAGSLVTYHTPPRETPDIVGLFFSTGLSPYGRDFMPALVEYYEDKQREFGNFEIIFVSTDPDAATMQAYVSDYEMPFPVLAYGTARNLPADLRKLRGRGVPNLVLVGPDGAKIADSFRGDDYIGPEPVLNTLTTLLEYGVPAAEEKEPETETPQAQEGGVTMAPAPAPAPAPQPEADTPQPGTEAPAATDEIAPAAAADTAGTPDAADDGAAPANPFGSPAPADPEDETDQAEASPFAVPAESAEEEETEEDDANDNPFGF